MKKVKWLSNGLFIFLTFTCSLLSGCFPNFGQVRSGNNISAPVVDIGAGEYVADQILVRFKPGANIDQILKPLNGRIIKYNRKLDFYQIGFTKTNKLNVLGVERILRDSNQVFIAEPNYVYKAYGIPNDPDYSKQWGLEKINAPAGWESNTGSSGITIAILDTGIDDTHPDLNGKVLSGYNTILDTVGLPGDDHGHGTHCAGIAASLSNNNIGVAGVAWQCNLMAVKVLSSDGYGANDDIIEGIVWAVDNGANVISMSLGGPGYSRLLQNAVDYALSQNVVIVAAAGNDSKLNDNNFPSCFPGVISVGATNPKDGKASFSTESNSLFIAAPGERIYSTLPEQQYGYKSGTSMATPFVSGAVALIKSKFGAGIPVSQVFSQLKKTATDIGAAGWDQQTGWGRLNLPAAVGNLQPDEFGQLIVTVNDDEAQPVPNAQILLTNTSTGKVIYNIVTGTNELFDGAISTGQACFWSLPAGSYTVTANVMGYQTTATYTVAGGGVTVETLTLQIPAPIAYTDFNETAENSPSQVVAEGTWGKTNDHPHSGLNSWTDSPDGNYTTNTDMSLVTVPINLNGSINPVLHFWHRYSTKSEFDYCSVEVSTDYGTTWDYLADWSGSQADWTETSVDLTEYKTQR
ncbi:MAG TPA: S8 family serine peptidase, partial [Bacillota bacterium]|nr:S8 family serine peptidase [Bacillota bacterium]